MSNEQTTADVVGAALGSKTTYAGAGVTIGSWFLSNEFFGLVGVIIGMVGLFTNLYFRRKQDTREQHEYEARMRAMGQEP